ncbi:MAG: hypothetical protein MK078_08315 [Crocinitomicaceae bacterium]|nr:hypothetical protein [Crocinitomicaceae bacterium]
MRILFYFFLSFSILSCSISSACKKGYRYFKKHEVTNTNIDEASSTLDYKTEDVAIDSFITEPNIIQNIQESPLEREIGQKSILANRRLNKKDN